MVGGGITTLIFSTEPTATRGGATRQTAMLVDVTEVQRDTYRPVIQAVGTVVPSQDITLSPRVSGEIIERSPSFTPGGYVEKGDTLLQIDPADYRNTLQQRRSELNRALSDLKVEMGRQEAAMEEYRLYGDTLSEQNRSLVLREPQLESVKASVQSARAAVEQAELNLQRTTIRAPFDAQILDRNVNVGSQVAPGDDLGRLVGVDSYWVEASVPLSKVRWLNFSEDGGQRGSEVRVRNRTAWPEGEFRRGYLDQLVGALEGQTRMARVLVTVPDPRGYQSGSANRPSLMVGSFVEANMEGKELAEVVRLDRDYLREDETVWVMHDGKLQIREVDIVFQDARYAYISSGLQDGDQVITTNLSTVTEGAPVRTQAVPPERDSTTTMQ